MSEVYMDDPEPRSLWDDDFHDRLSRDLQRRWIEVLRRLSRQELLRQGLSWSEVERLKGRDER